MMALVFGDEKKAKPRPRRARTATMKPNPVSPSRPRARRRSPPATRAIPAEATTWASIRSESLPAQGDRTAWTAGWAARTNPAARGDSPFTVWR